MTFEQAAALKILFGTEEVQVITDDKPVETDDGHDDDEPVGVIVKQHGIINVDVVTFDVEEAVQWLAEVYELGCD